MVLLQQQGPELFACGNDWPRSYRKLLNSILFIRSLAHQAYGFVVFALLLSAPRREFPPKDSCLCNPIVFSRGAQLTFDLRQTIDLHASLLDTAAASKSEPASPNCNCRYFGRTCRIGGDRRSFFPSTSLNCIPHRHRGFGVGGLEPSSRLCPLDFQLIDHFCGLCVPSALKIGIDEIIHRVKLFTNVSLLMSRLPCRDIAGDGFIP